MATVDTSGSRGAAPGSRRSRGSAGSPAAPRGACGFWLHGHLLALDVALVGEMVEVEQMVPVPRSHPAVLGIFNLRGVPVALVDLSLILGLKGSGEPKRPGPRRVLVVRAQGVVAGFAIDRVDAVIPAHEGRLVAASIEEASPVVLGVLEVGGERPRTLSVLAPDVLLERLRALKPSVDAGT
jgi:chemotaxis signal transduction protein